MNNQLRYRVWCTDFQEWEKDRIVVSPDGTVFHISLGLHQIRAIRPEHHIVQLFSGLRDKNGKDIYEGDILNYVNDYGEAMESGETASFYSVKFKNGGFFIGDYDFLADANSVMSVVGNIFQNPELAALVKP